MKSTNHFLLGREFILKMMINVLFCFLCLVTSNVNGMQSSLQEEDLELERQLQLINKPPVKSIHTKFGHIVDCIDIYKQPAFDHPLLKDHRLQREPSFQQVTSTNSKLISIIGLEKGSCPPRTVPIRRTTKKELIQSKILFKTLTTNQDTFASRSAGVYLQPIPRDTYVGVSGSNSIWNPKVYNDQTTASHLWVQNGEGDSTNKIMVGWHVSSPLYGNGTTYSYSLWTSDNFKNTGCYNLQCSGFVQTETGIYLGSPALETSVYDGEMIEMTLSVIQDPKTKNWWLSMENKSIGYFPAELFSNMPTADQVGWGGRTTFPMGQSSPAMGSGYFPDGNLLHACYFINVEFHTPSGTYEPGGNLAQEFTDNSNCFRAEFDGNSLTKVGSYLMFGGPGGNCGN